MNSLARESRSFKGEEGFCTPCEPCKPQYPEICLYDNQVEAFLDGTRIEPGKVYEGTIQFRLKVYRDTNPGVSVDLCILSGGDVVEVGEEEEKEEATAPKTEVTLTAEKY